MFTTEWGECDYSRIGEGRGEAFTVGGGRESQRGGVYSRRGKGEVRCLQ